MPMINKCTYYLVYSVWNFILAGILLWIWNCIDCTVVWRLWITRWNLVTSYLLHVLYSSMSLLVCYKCMCSYVHNFNLLDVLVTAFLLFIGSPCLAIGLMYNQQQEQYCLIPSPGLPWPQGVSVMIVCRFRLRPTGHSDFRVSHNDVNLTSNSSKYAINRPSAEKEREILRVRLNVLNFTESDTGNYTCSADFVRQPTIQNTTAVYINSSSTPCVPKRKSSPVPRRKNEPNFSIVIYIPISPTSTVETEVPTSSEIVPSSGTSSVQSPVQKESVSSVPSPVQRESSSSVPSPVQKESSSSVPSPVQTEILPSTPEPKQQVEMWWNTALDISSCQYITLCLFSQPYSTIKKEATTTCVLVVQENVTKVHANAFIAISVVVILVMAVGTAIISVTVICTRRTSRAGNFIFLCHLSLLIFSFSSYSEKERGRMNGDCVIYQIPDTSEIHFQPRPSDTHVDV